MRNAKCRMQNVECGISHSHLSLASLTRISHSHLSHSHSHSPLSLLKRWCLLVTVALEVIVAGRRSEFG